MTSRNAGHSASALPDQQRGGVLSRRAERGDECPPGSTPEFSRLQECPPSERGALAASRIRRWTPGSRPQVDRWPI